MSYESEVDSLDNLSTSDPLCWVYVLETDDGSYVGQTTDLERRVGEHVKGYSSSTAGTSPYLVWEKRLLTRGHADSYERVLKTLRDCDQATFYELTGVQPQAWVGVGSDIERERIEQRHGELFEQRQREWQQRWRERSEQRRREREQSQQERSRTKWRSERERQREGEPYLRKVETIISPTRERGSLVAWLGRAALSITIFILVAIFTLLGFVLLMVVAMYVGSLNDDVWIGWRLLGGVVVVIWALGLIPTIFALHDKVQSLTRRERDQRR